MTDGPKCASCGGRLVAGNNVVRVQPRDDGRGHAETRWLHAACEHDYRREHLTLFSQVERGRLVIITEYKLDFELTRG